MSGILIFFIIFVIIFGFLALIFNEIENQLYKHKIQKRIKLLKTKMNHGDVVVIGTEINGCLDNIIVVCHQEFERKKLYKVIRAPQEGFLYEIDDLHCKLIKEKKLKIRGYIKQFGNKNDLMFIKAEPYRLYKLGIEDKDIIWCSYTHEYLIKKEIEK